MNDVCLLKDRNEGVMDLIFQTLQGFQSPLTVI